MSVMGWVNIIGCPGLPDEIDPEQAEHQGETDKPNTDEPNVDEPNSEAGLASEIYQIESDGFLVEEGSTAPSQKSRLYII